MRTKSGFLNRSFASCCLIAMFLSFPVNAGTFDDPPLCSFMPGDMIQIEGGATTEYQICVQSFQGPVNFITNNAPAWCSGSGASSDGFVGENGGCATAVCEPPLAAIGQTFTVDYLVTDETSGLQSTCSIDLVVIAPPPPLCSFMPSGQITIPPGGTDQYQICVEALRGPVDFLTTDAPPWCSGSGASSDGFVGEGGGCATAVCSPPLSAAGQTFTVNYVVTDQETGATSQCSFDIVVGPPPCDDLPICTPSTTETITLRGGVNDALIEICGESACGNTVSLHTPAGLPAWVTPQDTFDDDQCITYLIDPPGAEFGVFSLVYLITDDVNAQSSVCKFLIDVQACDISPECTVAPEGPITVFVGEEVSFEVCGTSFCEGAITLDSSPLPAWLMDSAGGMVGDTFCRSYSGTPPAGSEGTYTINLFVEDSVNGNLTECSVDVIVLCPDPPICSFTESGPIEVEVGELIDFEFCGEPACADHRVRIEMPSRPPFIDPAGHQKGDINETICLPITGTPGPQHAGTSWNMRVKVTDLVNGKASECSIPIRVLGNSVCDEPPVCEIAQGDTIEVGLNEPFDIEICASSLCSTSSVTIEPLEPTILCDSFGILDSEPGEELCATLPCSTFGISEPGEYLVRFLVTDTGNGQSSICETLVIAGGGSPGCAEEEPNNEPALCTMLDARACQSVECGFFVHGYLDPSGDDVDFYCIEGLNPGAVYRVRAIGGVNQSLEFTCAQAVCVDESGARIGSTGGEQGAVECAADDSGTLFIAVSGCGDLDLDGQIDDELRGNPPHGAVGAYQVLVSPASDLDEALLPCHADMNSDGMVNSADLGMLIGVFGEICAP